MATDLVDIQNKYKNLDFQNLLISAQNSSSGSFDNDKIIEYNNLPQEVRYRIGHKTIHNICQEYILAKKNNQLYNFYRNFKEGCIYKQIQGFIEYYGQNGLYKFAVHSMNPDERHSYMSSQAALTELRQYIQKNLVEPYISYFKGMVGKNKDGNQEFKKVATSEIEKDEDGILQKALFYPLKDSFGRKLNFYFRKFSNIFDFYKKYKNYQLVSLGLFQTEREMVVVDCDNEDNYFTSVSQIEEFIKKVNDEYIPVSYYRIKDTLHFQIGWRLKEPISLYSDEGYYIREKNAFYLLYTSLYKNLNRLFKGDKRFSGWICQNPFYENKEIVSSKVYEDRVYSIFELVKGYNILNKTLFDNSDRKYDTILQVSSAYNKNNYGLSSVYDKVVNGDMLVESQEEFEEYLLCKNVYEKYSNKFPFKTTGSLSTYDSYNEYELKMSQINGTNMRANSLLDLQEKLNKDYPDISEPSKIAIKKRFDKGIDIIFDDDEIRTNCEILYSKNRFAQNFLIKDEEVDKLYSDTNQSIEQTRKQVCKEIKSYTNNYVFDNLTSVLFDSDKNIYNQKFLCDSRIITLCNWSYTFFMREARRLSIEASQENGKITIRYPSLNSVIKMANEKYYPLICDILNKHNNKSTYNEISKSVTDSYNKAKSQFEFKFGSSKNEKYEQEFNSLYTETLNKIRNNQRVDVDELSRKIKYYTSKSNSEIYYTDSQRDFATLIHYTNKIVKILQVREYFDTAENPSYRNFIKFEKNRLGIEGKLKGYSIANLNKLYNSTLSIEDFMKVKGYLNQIKKIIDFGNPTTRQKEMFSKLGYAHSKLEKMYGNSIQSIIETGSVDSLKLTESERFYEKDYEKSLSFIKEIGSEIFINERGRKFDEYVRGLMLFLYIHSIMRKSIKGKLQEFMLSDNQKYFDSKQTPLIE